MEKAGINFDIQKVQENAITKHPLGVYYWSDLGDTLINSYATDPAYFCYGIATNLIRENYDNYESVIEYKYQKAKELKLNVPYLYPAE